MITLYSFPTPNGYKASIALEELALPYRVHRIDVNAGDQLKPNYLAISPLGKIPAIVDDDGDGPPRRVFGSGAILIYLAEKTGRLFPAGLADRAEALSWLAFGVSDVAPTAQHLFRFALRAPEKLPYAIDLFKGEMSRCWAALDAGLESGWQRGGPFLVGDFSIADIACFPFVATKVKALPNYFDAYRHIRRWHDDVLARPGVRRGLDVPAG